MEAKQLAAYVQNNDRIAELGEGVGPQVDTPSKIAAPEDLAARIA